MPWYRVPGVGMTHFRMPGPSHKWPKPCMAHLTENGINGEWCQAMAEFQCDWKVPGGRCDKWLCKPHALTVAENKHLCPVHQAAYVKWADGVREARKLKAV